VTVEFEIFIQIRCVRGRSLDTNSMSPRQFLVNTVRNIWNITRNTRKLCSPQQSSVSPNPSVTSALNFNDLQNGIHSLLRTYGGSSAEISEAVKSLRDNFPRPLAEIVDKNVWETEFDLLVVKSHLNYEFQDAVWNIQNIRATYTAEDERYLRLILTHWCGWSATDPNHSADSWVQYLRAEYAQLKNWQPILDSLTWVEELSEYPIGGAPIRPWLFLLSTKEFFYIYDVENASLCCAGSCLRDVYEGLKAGRFQDWREQAWEPEERCIEQDPGNYFPYYLRTPSGDFSLFRQVKEFSEDLIDASQ
jgi:hypothetical protein